jgi:hypothetical protein
MPTGVKPVENSEALSGAAARLATVNLGLWVTNMRRHGRTPQKAHLGWEIRTAGVIRRYWIPGDQATPWLSRETNRKDAV